MKKVNVIDLDKTLIPYDSFRKIIIKEVLKLNTVVIWILFLRTLGLLNSKDFKDKVSRNLNKKNKIRKLENHVDEIYSKINPKIKDIIANETDTSTENVLISASPDLYIKLLIEKLEWKGVGSYFGVNDEFVHLHGKSKIKWLKDHFPQDKFIYNFAISDCDSDDELLSLFNKSIKWKNQS